MATQRLPLDNPPERHRSSARKWLSIALIVLAALLAAAGALLAVKWPFTRKRVTESLQQATATKVHIGRFKAEYFPHPGCVADQVTFQGKQPGSQPLMSIRRLVVSASFLGMFRKHLAVVRAEGTHIALPPFGSGQSLGGKNQGGTVIDRLVADGTVLEVLPKNAHGEPTRFVLRRFELRGLGGNRRLSFHATVDTPKPPGIAVASGTFGPWRSGSAASTPVSGRYNFQHANLAVFRGISGTLASQGAFEGSFQQLQVQGTTDTPDFEAANSGHKFHLSTQFRALVNATNGDVVLQDVAALLGHSTIAAQGRIAGTPSGRGKTLDLNFTVLDGRIEDVLLLFVKDKRAPLMGETSFRAHVVLPPGPQPFMRKVQLAGEFGIGGAHFTSPHTENSVTQLSLRARGKKEKVEEDPQRVLSNLRGHVALKNGLARFTNLSFDVPGARAHMRGTYNLVNERINLHGLLYMQGKLSNATSGIKSFLLKALGPILKSNHRGELVPVGITGTYRHPSYHISPQSKK